LRFLIDNALSPVVARELAIAGHDAIHVRDIGLATARDATIFARAAADDRIVVSADTDFGTLLALRDATKPSVILFRLQRFRSPMYQAALMLANLPALEEALAAGCVAVFEKGRIRLRPLPF
jgi:predicted nuclease of predicted toxin-antitoxin system